MAIDREKARAYRAQVEQEKRLGLDQSTFAPELAEHGVFWTKEQFELKIVATELSLRAATSLALEIYPKGDPGIEKSQKAVEQLGVHPVDAYMTPAEGEATAVADYGAGRVLEREHSLTLKHALLIFNQYRPELQLGDEQIERVLAGLNFETIDDVQVVRDEDLQVRLEGPKQSIPLSADAYVSILVADLYERAREGRSVFDQNDKTLIAKLASKLRNKLNIGILTQRSSEVIEEIKLEKKDSLPPDILALLQSLHGKGFHGTGLEIFFVKMADGSVVKQTRMKECNTCSHDAQESIVKNAPEKPISEMVIEFEARQIELQPKQEIVLQETLIVPPFYGGPIVSVWSSKAAKEVSATASEPASPTPSNRMNGASKPRPTQAGARPVNRQISSNEGVHNEHAPSPKADAMTASRPTRKSEAPRIEIVTLSSGQTAVVSGVERLKQAGSRPKETRNNESVPRIRKGQRQPQRRAAGTETRRASPPMLARRLSIAPSDSPSFTRPQGQGQGGERPSILNTPKRKGDSITVRQAARRVTGSKLQQAIARVEAKVIEKTAHSSSTERVIAEKKEPASVRTQIPLIVNSVANAVIHDGQQATTANQPKQGKVIKTQSKATKKRKLRSSNMALQLALPSSSHDIDVLNPMSARRMVYASLPLVA